MKKHYEIDLRRNVMEFDKESRELKFGWLYGIHESGIPIINLINRVVLDRDATIKLVVEYNTEPLDEIEKRYLENVIRPFQQLDVRVVKSLNWNYNQLCNYISILIENDDELRFPDFPKDTMYKNMIVDKEYTLKELGLFQ